MDDKELRDQAREALRSIPNKLTQSVYADVNRDAEGFNHELIFGFQTFMPRCDQDKEAINQAVTELVKAAKLFQYSENVPNASGRGEYGLIYECRIELD